MGIGRGGLIMALLASTSVLSGCSLTGCSGVHAQAASITVDAAQWTKSHPRQQVRVCLDRGCEVLSSSTNVSAGTVEPANHPYVIALVDIATGAKLGSLTTKLPTVTDSTGCGTATRQAGTIAISSTGVPTLNP